MRLLFLIGLLAVPHALPAQAPTRSDRIDALFADYNQPGVPGCAVATLSGDRVDYSAGYGEANLDYGIKIEPTTVFNLASLTKQFTAAAVAMLVREGRPSLDDDIRKYLPEMPSYGKAITIRHLIYHTSGIRDRATLASLNGYSSGWDTDDVLALIFRQRALNFPPGTEYVYSNSNYVLLAEIVERVSGVDFPDFLQKRIFEPLGMKNTGFPETYGSVIPNEATGYSRLPDGTYTMDELPANDYGAGHLRSTVLDLMKWARAWWTGALVDRALARSLLSTGSLDDGTPITYAFGVGVAHQNGALVANHSGSEAAFSSAIRFAPDARVAVAVLCNTPTATVGKARQIMGMYLPQPNPAAHATPARGAAPSRHPRPLTPGEISQLAGVYHDPTTDRILRFNEKNGRLDLAMGPGLPVEGVGADTLVAGGMVTYAVQRNSEGRPVRMIENMGGRTTTFDAVDADLPGPDKLQEYVGRYGTDEIDSVLRVTVKDGQLVLHTFEGSAPLRPAFTDAFNNQREGLSDVRFLRDGAGHVTALSLTTGRGIRKMRFDRLSH